MHPKQETQNKKAAEANDATTANNTNPKVDIAKDTSMLTHSDQTINPATQANILEEIEAIFVPNLKDGKWGVHKHFKKLGAVYADEDDGWWIPIEQADAVVALCEQTQMGFQKTTLLANSWASFTRKHKKDYLVYLREERIEPPLLKLKRKLDFVWFDHKKSDLTEEQINALNQTSDGKKFMELIKEYKQKNRAIQRIENEELVEKVKPAKQSSYQDIDENRLTFLFEDYSEQQLIEDFKNEYIGVETGYNIGDVDLAFPGGAITIIAAPTSHGKTTALINFTLGMLEKNPEKHAYFFSYEESVASIHTSFLNTWISKKIHKINPNAQPLSKNNKRSIKSHFRGNDEYFKQDMLYEFIREKNSYFNELINNGRLRVIHSEMKANELVEAIKLIKDKDPNIALICIDYMQLLTAEKPRQSRQEELKQICLMLKECAIETGLPIVITAQFNRTVVAEQDLSPVNIGEAGDIERVANLIIGMFNRNFNAMSKAGNIGRDGNPIEKQPVIYFEILKGRDVGTGHSSVMEFSGNKGLISNQQEEENPF